MLVVPEFNSDEPSVRTHPWSFTEYKEDGGAYYDFTKVPELIPHVLEDFRPYSDRKAIQLFYQFLAWTNGPDSVLETTDCALRPPVKNKSFFKGQFRIGGRVEILYRDYQRNIDLPCFQWMWRMFCLYLEINRPNFYDAVIEVAAIQTDYIGLPQPQCRGHRLRLTFNAHGDTEIETFDRLFHVFDGIWEATRRVSNGTKVPMPPFP